VRVADGGVGSVHGIDVDKVGDVALSGANHCPGSPVSAVVGTTTTGRQTFPGTVVGGFLEVAQRPMLGGRLVPGDLGGSQSPVKQCVADGGDVQIVR